MKINITTIRLIIKEELDKIFETRNKIWKSKVAQLRQRWDKYQKELPQRTMKDIHVFGYWQVEKEKEAINKLASSFEYDDNMEQEVAIQKAKQTWSAMSEQEKEDFYKENYIDDYDQFEKKMDVQAQSTIDLDKPEFAKGKSYYDPTHEIGDQRTYEHPEHAAELRRVKFGQTKAEIQMERELMKLWQEMADIDFFKSDEVTYTHDVGYKSAANMIGRIGLKTDSYNKTDVWIQAQNTPQKSALSTTAKIGKFPSRSQQMGLSLGFGYYVKGHPIFLSSMDLASQTQKMAGPKVRQYYKSSGLPKRASLSKFGKKPEISRLRRKRMKRKGQTDEEIDAMLENYSDAAILDKKDMLASGGGAMEAIIDNWTIAAWFVEQDQLTSRIVKSFFTQNAAKITKPIYIGNESYTIKEFLRIIK
jgi:hypothetical protein